MYDTFSAYFDGITAGTYNVIVYYLNAEAGNTSTCLRTQWTSEAAEGETDSIRVDYFTVINEVEVTVTAIHNPDQDKTDGRYTIVLQDTADESKVFTETATSDDSNEIVSAVFDNITAGTYNVTVYYLNVEGGNTSTCARTQWTSEAAKGETDNVRVEYNLLTEEINVSVVAIHNPSDSEEATTPDTTKPADSNQAESTTVAASTSTDNSTSPKTGDTTALEIYVLMTVVSGLVIAFFIYRKKANSVG
jgi:hypothetical protein